MLDDFAFVWKAAWLRMNQLSSNSSLVRLEAHSSKVGRRRGMYSKTFNDVCDWTKKNSHVLTWAAIYGGRDRLYAGI